MKFGVLLHSHVGKADVVVEAEALGFHRACVLRPGDRLTDRRIVDQTGSMVTAISISPMRSGCGPGGPTS